MAVQQPPCAPTTKPTNNIMGNNTSIALTREQTTWLHAVINACKAYVSDKNLRNQVAKELFVSKIDIPASEERTEWVAREAKKAADIFMRVMNSD